MFLGGTSADWRGKAFAAALAFFLFGSPGALDVGLPSCGYAFATSPCATMNTSSDRDGDGVPDCQDQCPNVSGTSGNGGCPDSWWQSILNVLAHAWTSVNTLLGYLYGAFTYAWTAVTTSSESNDRVTISYNGQAMEFQGSALPFIRRKMDAVTIGATVHYRRGVNVDCRSRAHEAEHVRQYLSWGPLYLIAYAGLSIIQGYDNNLFERQARAAEAVCDE